MKRPERRFTVGSWVRVRAAVERVRSRPHILNGDVLVTFKREPCRPFTGQVVGARWRPIGHRVPGSGSTGFYESEPDYDPPTFQRTGGIFVWLVSRGMLNRPVEVLDRDLAPAETPAPNLPWQYNRDRGGWRMSRAFTLWERRQHAHEVADVLDEEGGES